MTRNPKPTAAPETAEMVSPSGIARSNRMFIQLQAVGEVDAKGKVIFASRGYEKVIAVPDKPITTCILPLLIVLLERTHFVNDETAQAELLALQKYVAGLSLSTRKAKVHRDA